MHRLTGFALLVASCSSCGSSSSAPTTVGNRTAPPPPACPADPGPFVDVPPVSPSDECLHGAAEPMLAGGADAPRCYLFQVTGPTSADEAITLDDGRRVWLNQGGCVHATIRIRAQPARAVDAGDRGAVLAAAAELLGDLDAVTTTFKFSGLAADLAAAAPARPLSRFPLGAGDWTVEVETMPDGALAIELDFPL